MSNDNGHSIYEFDGFRLDVDKLMLYRDETEISLPPKVIKTLAVLVKNGVEIMSKDELIGQVWEDSIVEESNLSQYLYLLRKTLGNLPDGRPYIETLRRRGYRFNGNVHRIAPSSESSNVPIPVRAPHIPQYGFERRGNVVALVDWSNSSAGTVVADPVLRPAPQLPEAGVSWKRIALIAALAVILIAGLAVIAWFGSAEPQEGEVRNDLTVTNLTNGNDVRDATISRDGNYFVYHEQDGDTAHVYLQQVGQSKRVEIIPAVKGTIAGKTFSPDGKYIYLLMSEGPNTPNSLHRVPTLGGVSEKILSGINSAVSFSPDGNQVAFTRRDVEREETSIVVAPSDRPGPEQTLLTRSGNHRINYNPAWSPDGTLMAFGLVDMAPNADSICTISAISPSTGSVITLSHEKWDMCYRMEWTRDGKELVFVGTKAKESYSSKRDQVYVLSRANGKSRRITTDGSRYESTSLGVTDDGSILAVPYNRAAQVWSMDANGDSRTAVQLTNGLADGRAGLAPLPDGRIGYIARTGDSLNIWLMDADGSNRKQVTSEPATAEELRLTPDGRFFIFSAVAESGGAQLFRIDTEGRGMVQLTFENGNVVDSSVSPDSRWLVYHHTAFVDGQHRGWLKKIPLDGGDATVLSDDDCGMPHYSPDGRYISCVYFSKSILAVISAEDGSPIAKFETLKNPLINSGTRWTLDGKGLVYMVMQKKSTNLWVQPLDGSEPQPLTDFSSGGMYNFAFAADGSRLFVSRGYEYRDAVLIKNVR